MLMDVIKDTALDSIKLLPFLYITYLLIELIEHKVGEAGRARIGAPASKGAREFAAQLGTRRKPSW